MNVNKQSAYSIIKILIMFVLFYEFLNALVFAFGGKFYLGGIFGCTLIVYVAFLFITYTKSGSMYFSNFFRTSLYLLAVSNVCNTILKFFPLGIKQRYCIVAALLFFGFISFVIGLLYAKSENDSKQHRNNRE